MLVYTEYKSDTMASKIMSMMPLSLYYDVYIIRCSETPTLLISIGLGWTTCTRDYHAPGKDRWRLGSYLALEGHDCLGTGRHYQEVKLYYRSRLVKIYVSVGHIINLCIYNLYTCEN